MEQLSFLHIAAYFLIYSVLGWMVEVAFQALTKGIISNRGFLCGPVCPIYGCGVVSILLLLRAIGSQNPEAVHATGIFFIGVLLSTAIELFGGWALDKLFHMRWWDYRSCRFNLNGYICPLFSMLWGGGILIVVRIIHPFIRGIVGLIPEGLLLIIILAVLYAGFIADIVVSVLIMVGLNRRFKELDEAKAKMRVLSDKMSYKIATETLENAEKAEKLKQKAGEKRDEMLENLTELRENISEKGGELRESLSERSEDFRESLSEKSEELRASLSEKKDAALDSIKEAEENFEGVKKALYDKLISSRVFGSGRVFFGNVSSAHRDYAKYIEELREERENRKKMKKAERNSKK